MTLDVKDALDIAHCIVPAAYADFVLLDRRWYVRLKDAEGFLRSVGIETRIAEQYTRRDGGVLKFLERLEAWPQEPEARTRGALWAASRERQSNHRQAHASLSWWSR